jgi:class 3 adenylate cyclase
VTPVPQHPGTDSAHVALSGARILVVDDDLATRRVVRLTLARHCAQVLEASNGKEAVELAKVEDLDLVLLDVHMPVLDGLGACRAMRAVPSLRLLPIVFLTGGDDDDQQIEALRAGGDDFVTKPFTPPVLLARISNLVTRRRAQVQVERLLELLKLYVPLPIRERAVGKAPAPLPAERVEATILFSDLRGFTTTCHTESPERVFRAVSAVLAEQTRIVVRRNGYVDKFSGDGLLAVFEGPDSAADACGASLEIVQWAKNFAGISFWNPPPIGIGIHHGEFLRGDLGGDEQLEYTVIGGTVNVAARLCGAAGALETIVSQDVVDLLQGRFLLGEARAVHLKGLEGAARVHPVLATSAATGLPGDQGAEP